MEARAIIEAGRALVLWGALQVDLTRRSPDEAERAPPMTCSACSRP